LIYIFALLLTDCN